MSAPEPSYLAALNDPARVLQPGEVNLLTRGLVVFPADPISNCYWQSRKDLAFAEFSADLEDGAGLLPHDPGFSPAPKGSVTVLRGMPAPRRRHRKAS